MLVVRLSVEIRELHGSSSLARSPSVSKQLLQVLGLC
jgi:hypothetical protein